MPNPTESAPSRPTLLGIKGLIQTVPAFSPFYKTFRWLRTALTKLPIPQDEKWQIIDTYASRFQPPIFVETGTLLGDTTAFFQGKFEELYTIELDHAMSEAAKERFSQTRKVKVLEGDSGQLLNSLLSGINRACLFWLDAHYSNPQTARGDQETPILSEVETILSHPIRDHLILIDDARLFKGKNDYPTLQELNDLVTHRRSDLSFSVDRDIIRIVPRGRPHPSRKEPVSR